MTFTKGLNSKPDGGHDRGIKTITDEIAAIEEQRKSLKKEFQEKDAEYSTEISMLIKERLKLVNESKYGK